MASESEAFQELQEAVQRFSGRRFRVERASRLREDLALDSMNLIELSIWVHERFGVDLGRIAEEEGRAFLTIEDLLNEVAHP